MYDVGQVRAVSLKKTAGEFMEALLPSIATLATSFEKMDDFEHFKISASSQSLFAELWLHIISLVIFKI